MPECSDRVEFRVRDAPSYDGTYDLICMFDTLHDLGDPVGALAFAKAHLTEDGWFFAVEPNAGDRLEDNLHPLGLIWYASGHNLCVPNAVSQGGAALGNQAGLERTLRAFAEGGFTARPQGRRDRLQHGDRSPGVSLRAGGLSGARPQAPALTTNAGPETKNPHTRWGFGAWRTSPVAGAGFEPAKAYADGFTVRSHWPLGQPAGCRHPG